MEQIRDTTKNRFSDIVKALKVHELTNVPCFFKNGDKWCAAEELILLSALQTFGYGNWKVIADTLTRVCDKEYTSLEVQMHYNDVYLEGEIGKAIRRCGIPPLKSSLVDHTIEEDDELVTSCDMRADLNVPEEFLEKIGYMPLREDFVVECKSNAENILKEVMFKENMDDFDKNLNFLMLDAYRETVKERILEKKIIRVLRLVEKYYELYLFKKNKKSPKTKPKLWRHQKQGKMFHFFKLFFQDNLKKGSTYSSECSSISLSSIASMFPERLKREFYSELFASNEIALKKKKSIVKEEEKDSEFVDLFTELHRRSPRLHAGSVKYVIPEIKREIEKITNLRRTLRSAVKRENNCSSSESSSDRGSFEKISECNFSLNIDETDLNPHIIYLYPCVEYLTREERNLCRQLNLQPLFFIFYKAFLMKEDLLKCGSRSTDLCLIPEGLKRKEAVHIYNFLKKNNSIKSSFEEFLSC